MICRPPSPCLVVTFLSRLSSFRNYDQNAFVGANPNISLTSVWYCFLVIPCFILFGEERLRVMPWLAELVKPTLLPISTEGSRSWLGLIHDSRSIHTDRTPFFFFFFPKKGGITFFFGSRPAVLQFFLGMVLFPFTISSFTRSSPEHPRHWPRCSEFRAGIFRCRPCPLRLQRHLLWQFFQSHFHACFS